MKHKIKIIGEIQRSHAIELLRSLPLDVVHTVEIKEYKPTRSLMQNSRLWGMLTDISRDVEWHGRKLSKENWKEIFSASLKKQEVIPGLDNNFVVLGASTSKMTVAEMSEMIELMYAFGAQHGVVWKEQVYED